MYLVCVCATPCGTLEFIAPKNAEDTSPVAGSVCWLCLPQIRLNFVLFPFSALCSKCIFNCRTHTHPHTPALGLRQTSAFVARLPAHLLALFLAHSLYLSLSLTTFFLFSLLSLALALGLSPAHTSSLPVAVLGFKPNVPHLCCTYFASCVRLCVCVFMQYYSYYTHTRTRSHINISL